MIAADLRRLASAAMLLVLAICSALAGEATDDDASPWLNGLAAGLAAGEGKPIVLMISTEGCEWCHRLLAESASNAETRQALTQVVGTVVRAEDEPQLVQRLGITAFPTLVLINRKRELVRAIRGYLPPQDLATTLRVLALHGDEEGVQPLDLQHGLDVDALLAAPDPIPGLVAALGVGDAATRKRVREALATRDGARPALWSALASDNLATRVDGAAALAQQVGAPSAYDPFAGVEARTAGVARWQREARDAISGGALP